MGDRSGAGVAWPIKNSSLSRAILFFGADQKPKADASGSSKFPPPAKPEAKPEQKSTTESRESRPEWSEYL